MFYNPAMAGDRDLSIAFGRSWAALHPRKLRGWEMLAATGVRGLRLLRESSLFESMHLTEAHPWAARLLAQNAEVVGGSAATVGAEDARRLPPGAPFDYVDLDPYGSPLPYLTTAVDALVPGGLLAVTATDLMVLAGVTRGACERLYGARPIRGRLGPEGGLRILLAAIDRVARRRGWSIRPRLCYVRGHAVRATVSVQPASTESSYHVTTVDPARFTGPWLPPGGPYGPLWTGPLFDRELVTRLEVPNALAQVKETRETIERLRDEAVADTVLFYEPNEIAHRLHLATPPPLRRLVESLRSQGWPTGRSHARAAAFRSHAPRHEVERVSRGVVQGRAG